MPANNACVDALKVHLVGSTQWAAIIREFILDVGLPEAHLLRDVPELRGYLSSQLGL